MDKRARHIEEKRHRYSIKEDGAKKFFRAVFPALLTVPDSLWEPGFRGQVDEKSGGGGSNPFRITDLLSDGVDRIDQLAVGGNFKWRWLPSSDSQGISDRAPMESPTLPNPFFDGRVDAAIAGLNAEAVINGDNLSPQGIFL